MHCEDQSSFSVTPCYCSVPCIVTCYGPSCCWLLSAPWCKPRPQLRFGPRRPAPSGWIGMVPVTLNLALTRHQLTACWERGQPRQSTNQLALTAARAGPGAAGAHPAPGTGGAGAGAAEARHPWPRRDPASPSDSSTSNH